MEERTAKSPDLHDETHPALYLKFADPSYVDSIMEEPSGKSHDLPDPHPPIPPTWSPSWSILREGAFIVKKSAFLSYP
jgi:hypothetical protein